MEDSILNSIKKSLGITPEYTQFDPEIIMHINSVFMFLQQIGVGPTNTYSIESDSETWTDFFSSANVKDVSAAKSLMFLKVKMLFDPPTIGSVNESYNKLIDELTWRCSIEGDNVNDGIDNMASGNEIDEPGIAALSYGFGHRVCNGPVLLHGPNFNQA